jgi:hypothetical protein
VKTTIGHLHCEYLIPASHPEPAALRARLDSVAHDYLAGVCSMWLTRLLDPHEPSIWLIRRLDVEVSLNIGGLDLATVAELWGRQLVKAIMRALTSAEQLDPERVMHFPDYNTYLAHFVSDLVAGRAWDQWYYRSFDSLRSLPLSAAIRTVMTREPERIAAVFVLLATQRRLEPVLECLTVHDAHTLYVQSYPVERDAADTTEIAPEGQHNVASERTRPLTNRAQAVHYDDAESVKEEASQAGTALRGASVNKPAVPPHADKSHFRAEEVSSRAETLCSHTEESSAGAEGVLPRAEEVSSRAETSPFRVETLCSHTEESSARAEGVLPRAEEVSSRAETSPFCTEEKAAELERLSLLAHEPSLRDDQSYMGNIEAIAAEEAAREGRHIIELLLSVWSKAALQLAGTNVASPHNALRLYTTLWKQVAHFSTIGVRDAIEHLLRFTELLHNIAHPDQLVSCLIKNNLTAAIALLQEARLLSYLPSLSYLQQTAAGDTALLRRVVSTVATSLARPNRSDAVRASGRESEVHSITTLLGGLFLLLPTFIDLKLPELLENAPYPATLKEHTTPLLRYLIFLKCFGLLYAQWPEIVHDPILLLVSNAEDVPLTAMLQQLSQVATVQMNDAWQRALIEQLARYRYIEGRVLFAELVEVEAGAVLLIRDMRSDAWLYIRSVPRELAAIQATLVHGVTLLREAIGQPAERLILGARLGQLSQLPIPTVLQDEQMSLRAADNDLRYLALHNASSPLIEQYDLDLTLSLFARTLLRSFARRLMGFDQSSATYLYQNFLTGTSSVTIQPGLLAVQLPCSPLHLVLRIAGMHEQSYTLLWCGDMHVHVTLAC